jgi:hypothetical protein
MRNDLLLKLNQIRESSDIPTMLLARIIRLIYQMPYNVCATEIAQVNHNCFELTWNGCSGEFNTELKLNITDKTADYVYILGKVKKTGKFDIKAKKALNPSVFNLISVFVEDDSQTNLIQTKAL